MCRFPKKEISEISEISIIQDNTEIHIDPKPRAEICGNYLEISRKFLGNFDLMRYSDFQEIHFFVVILGSGAYRA